MMRTATETSISTSVKAEALRRPNILVYSLVTIQSGFRLVAPYVIGRRILKV